VRRVAARACPHVSSSRSRIMVNLLYVSDLFLGNP